MGLGNWLRTLLGRGRASPETVPFLDVASGRVVRIPAAELRPGVIRVRLEGTDEVVWALAKDLRPGEVCHPPFDEGTRAYIRQIQAAFAEHRPLSFDEWEIGFRRDSTPEREIALWLHAAEVYAASTADEADPARRHDVYRCIVTCLVTGPADVWKVLRPEVLTDAEARRVVDRFFGKDG